MSIAAVRAVLERSRSRGGARLVMIVLAEHAGPDGVAWPSVATIAQEAGLSGRQVRRHLAVCVATGELAVVAPPTQHRPARYRVDVVPAPERTPATTLDASDPGPRVDTHDHPGRPRVDTHDHPGRPRVDTGGRQSGHRRSPEWTPTVPRVDTDVHRTGEPEEPPAEPGLAAGGCAAGVRASLVGAGVGEPALSRLAALPGLTGEVVADAWAAIRAAGGTVGLLITRLPELAAQATAAAAAAAQRAETIRRQEAQRAAERAAVEQAAAERARIVDDLERAGELEAYEAEAERRVPAMIARPWRGRPTRECGRAEAVARLWRSGWRPGAALRIAAGG